MSNHDSIMSELLTVCMCVSEEGEGGGALIDYLLTEVIIA